MSKFNLEERTLNFAKNCRDYIKLLPKTITNLEYGKQLVRSSGSVGANYIEANESLSRKDFIMRIRISKKETKESRYWLNLAEPNENYANTRDNLIEESFELMKIFGAIIEKSV